MTSPTASFVLSIDQGTTSTRAILFDKTGTAVSTYQEEFEQIMPQPGWVEHDPLAILASVRNCVAKCCEGRDPAQIASVGITNQRETTVVWDKRTGAPLHNAIVWMDVRTASICDELEGSAAEGEMGGVDRFRARCGLPISHYFSGTKLRWILDNVDGARALAEEGHALFGTIDTWLAWNLTGGVDGGAHVTDVTNASRTMLMGLVALDWDPTLLDAFGVPRSMLPTIGPSGGAIATIAAGGLPPLAAGTPLAALIGDQSGALFGQTCFNIGDVKNTCASFVSCAVA
jgi:glycerol kinase